MHKSLIKQTLLCGILGPIGLARESMQFAITTTLLTLALVLGFTNIASWIWLIAVVFSAVIGALLVKTRIKREQIDNYHLSSFVGTVSCRVVAKGSVDRSYRKLLKKLKFRRKLGYSLNLCLGLTCLLLAYAIAVPSFFTSLFERQSTPETAAALAAGKNTPESYQTAPLLSMNGHGGYIVRSTNMLSGHRGPYRAVLELNCVNKKTTVSIRSTDILGTERNTVTIDVNEDRSQQTTWSIEDDFHTAISPQPVAMLKSLENKSDVVFQFQPFDSTKINKAHFDGHMINTAIAGIRKKCGW